MEGTMSRHTTESPSQIRITGAAIDWEQSPSPFGCEGLISMEIGSPFQFFPPTPFGVVDADHSDSTSVFSPSMFSPSNSKFAMTLRSLKKTEAASPNLYHNGIYSAPDLQLCENQSYKSCGQLSSSSSSSFKRSLYSAPSSSMRPTVDANRLLKQDIDHRIPTSTYGNENLSFFSPETSSKPNNMASGSSSSLTFRQNYGIADIKHSSRDIPTANLIKPGVARVPRKSNRQVGIDQRVLNSVSVLKNETHFVSSSSHEGNVDKSKKSNLISGVVGRSEFASPLLTNLRDESEQAYADSVMVTPTQCKCKKTKCLKLYCDCFALLRYCGPNCGCTDCHNSPAHGEIRRVAVAATMQRTATAFTSKVTPNSAHVAGCNCSKSNCLKKYCECFLGGATCGVSCKCQQCKNFPGSEALRLARKPEISTTQTSSSSKATRDRGNSIKSNRKAPLLRGLNLETSSDQFINNINSSLQFYPSLNDSLNETVNESLMRSRSDSTVSLSTMKHSGNDKNSTFTNWDVCVERPGRDGWASNEAIRKADDYSANESIVQFLPTPIEEMNRYSTRSSRSKEDIISCKEVLPFQSTCFQSITPSGPGPPPGFGPGTGPGLGIEQLFNYNQNTFELNEGINCNWNGPTIDFKDKTKSNILTERNLPKVHQLTTLTPSSPSYRIKSNKNNTPFKSNQALKKRKINEMKIVYPYFGNLLPHAPKICALRCLEYLNGSDFYSVSVVNHLWSKTATDNALWE